MKALVIVGHGSHLNQDSSLPVYEHAERIRRTGAFDEVVECFWKEEPSMRHVLDLVESEEVVVVPAFISEGYFTQQVIPGSWGWTARSPAGAAGSSATRGRSGPSRACRTSSWSGCVTSLARGGSPVAPRSCSSATAPTSTATRPA